MKVQKAPRQKTISATEFKATCLRLLEHLDPEGIVVTKRGRPIAQVTPVREMDNRPLIGLMRGKIRVKGKLFTTGMRWDAQS